MNSENGIGNMLTLESLLEDTLARLDKQSLKNLYTNQDEALVIENFLPAEILDSILARLPDLETSIHRNYIPGHKKGGSISRFDLDKKIPVIPQLYQSRSLWNFFEFLSGRRLLSCPESDPHTYALYYYTDEGDHVGYHYDTSYYKDSRYTLLFGLVDHSSCQLECQLYKDNPARETQQINIALSPGTLVFFNGDKLWHRVTPLGKNEKRIVLTMEFLTNRQMSMVGRFVSNMKDSIAYFGFRQVFGRK